MKYTKDLEIVGCESNIVNVKLTIDSDSDEDIKIFMEKIPAIRELLKPEPDKAQTTLDAYQRNLEAEFRLGKEHKKKLQEVSEQS